MRIEIIHKHQWNDFLRLQSLLMRNGRRSETISKKEMLKRLYHVFFVDLCIQKPPHYTWVALSGNNYLGHLWGCVLPLQLTSEEKKLNLFNVVVDPSCRRKGVGSKLYRQAEIFCLKNNIRVIDCQAKLFNKGAMSFCRKNGYIVDGVLFRRELL
ncbi:MAG: GNAT family N-acetyltransferase [Deltaproteobacteria bacterium]|nr:GNAT family N-acetyltransferase [Deltaproteobacteria bacterium]MBI2341484.1 GNAT family N-acetyltransferase [Deltaproteobacteria bacterium]